MSAIEAGLASELEQFLRSELGAQAQLRYLQSADGHAGLTFLFAVESEGATAEYVLRLPPHGVRRKGNTDVYRQVPLLRALHRAGLPVPAVRWARADESWFDRPFLVMERLPGRSFLIWDPDPVLARNPTAVEALWAQAASLLADFHRLDWRTALHDWEAPRALTEEIAFWRPVYERAPERCWIDAAQRVETALMDSRPADPPIGLVHGDYQLGNILFDRGRATGLIDWELAHIGAQTLDLGWLMMMADPQMWHADYRASHPLSVHDLVARYVQAMGRPVAHARWYQALAAYRFGAIACLNVKLHRKGQREDPFWERIALSIPYLFGAADTILSEITGSDRHVPSRAH